MVRAASEVGLATRYFGGGMVGLQYTTVKEQLGPALNNILDYDWWIPAPKMQFPGIMAFLKKYQAKAPAAGIDPLGWYLPPFAYANLQVLGNAIEGTRSLDQGKLADYIRSHSFKTIVGDVSYGRDGEWAKPRVLEVQFQGIKGHGLAQFKDIKTEAIIAPPEYQTGTVVPLCEQQAIGPCKVSGRCRPAALSLVVITGLVPVIHTFLRPDRDTRDGGRAAQGPA